MSAVSAVFAWRKAVVASDLPCSARCVALVVSLHMNANGHGCTVSTAKLAAEAGLSEPRGRAIIRDLVGRGWLVSITRHRGDGGRQTTNELRAAVPAAALLPALDDADEDPVEDPDATAGGIHSPTAGNSPSPTAGNSPSPTAGNSPSPTAGNSPSPTAGNSPGATAGNSPRGRLRRTSQEDVSNRGRVDKLPRASTRGGPGEVGIDDPSAAVS